MPFRPWTNPHSPLGLPRPVPRPTMGQVASGPPMTPEQMAMSARSMAGKFAGMFGPGSSSYLPYTKELNAGMGTLGGLIAEVQNSQAPSRLLDAATYGARQEAAARGLEGGVAASLGTAAQGNVRNAWEDMRQQRLAALLGQQIGAIGGIQGQEQQRRMLLAQLKAAQAAGDDAKVKGLLGSLGALVGGGAGLFFGGGNPQLGMVGASLGGSAGNFLGDIF